MNTDTPRTDAVRHDSGDETNPLMSPCSDGDWVPYEHAREQELRIAQLERELATERCETCNCELSACGEQNIDGTPSMDCQLCQASDRINTLERELAEAETALDDSSRALKMLQRHQNGAREITKCPNWETLEDWVTQLMSQLTTQRAALEKAREALETCRMVVQNEINVREMLGKPTQVWPDLLTGCVSGGGIEDAITTITAVLEATR